MRDYYIKLNTGKPFYFEAAGFMQARLIADNLHGQDYYHASLKQIEHCNNTKTVYGKNSTGYYRTINNRKHYT
jgi:hypothetical protein